MTRKRKIIISGIIVLLIFIGIYLFLQSDYMLNKARIIAENQLTERLKTEVELGSLSGNLLYAVKIDQLAIADKTKPEQNVISVSEIYVKYNLFKLLLKTVALTEISLQKPVIHARVDEQGNLNLTELIPEQEKQPKDEEGFKFQVKELELVDGDVYYSDNLLNIDTNINGLKFKISGPLSLWRHSGKFAFQNATVEVNNVKKRILSFNIDFELMPQSVEIEQLRLELDNSWIEAEGNTNFKTSTLQAKVNGEVGLKDVSSFFPSIERLEGAIQLEGDADGKWDAFSGRMNLSGPSLWINKLNVVDLSVDTNFTNSSFEMTKLSAEVADGRISATAQANIDTKQPDYSATLSVNSVQVEPILSGLILRRDESFNRNLFTGKVQGELSISGRGTDWRHLSSDGKFELLDAKLNSIQILPSRLDYSIRNEQLTVDANIDKIQMNVGGQLGLTNKTNLRVNITPIELSRIMEFTSNATDINGTGNFQARLTGELTQPEILSNLSVFDITLNGVRMGDASGEFIYSENNLKINPLTVRNVDTKTTVRGNVVLSEVPNVDLKVSLNPISLSEYTKLLSQDLDIGGQLLGEIDLQGPVTSLNGSGEIRTKDVNALKMPVEMTVPIQIEKNTVYIPKFMMKTTGGEFNISGMYSPDGEYEFQLISKNFDFDKASDIFGLEQFEGYGKITASGKGNISQPEAKMKLELKSVNYASMNIGDVVYEGSIKNQKFEFNAVAVSNMLQMEGKVGILHPMPFSVTVNTENLDLRELFLKSSSVDEIGGQITGVFDVNGEIANIRDIQGNIQLQSVDLQTANHHFFNTVPIRIELANQTVNVKQFELFQKTDRMNSETAEDLYLRLRSRQYILSAYSALVMNGKLSEENFDFTVKSNELDVSILMDFINRKSCPQAKQRNGTTKPPVNIEDISGVGGFKFHLTGSYSNPEFVLQWSFPDMSLASSNSSKYSNSDSQSSTMNIPVRSRGRVNYYNKLLTVELIQFAIYSNILNLKGGAFIDLSLSKGLQNLEKRLSGYPMNIQLTAHNWDISFIDQFVYNIQNFRGYSDLNMEIAGTPVNPKVSGKLNLSDVSLKSSFIPKPIKNLSSVVKVNLDLSKVSSLNQFSRHAEENYWLSCTLDYIKWNIEKSRYLASGEVKYSIKDRLNKAKKSWFEDDSLSAIAKNIKEPEVKLAFQGKNIDLGMLSSRFNSKKTGKNGAEVPFEGYTSLFATVSGTGIKLQNYTADVEINPLVLILGDYSFQNTQEINIAFRNGELKLNPLLLKNQEKKPISKLYILGSMNLDGQFNFKSFLHQFHLKMLSPFIADAPSMDGIASVWLNARGTYLEPEAFTRFNIQNIKIEKISKVQEDINIDTIAGSIALKNDILKLNPISLIAYNNQLDFNGTIPIDLGSKSSDSMEIFIKAEDIRLEPFSSLTSIVEEIKGRADIDLVLRKMRLSSNIEKEQRYPLFLYNHYITGNLTLKDGKIKLIHLNRPVEAVNLDLVARQINSTAKNVDKKRNEIQLNKLSFQIDTGKYEMTSNVKMNGLMPQLYDGTANAQKFPLSSVAEIFLKEEQAKNLSGHLSFSAKTKLNIQELLNILLEVQHEKRLWKFISTAKGSKITIPEINIQVAGHSIYNKEKIILSLAENALSLSNFKLNYQTTSENPVFLNASGKWSSDNQLKFELNGSVDMRIISELTPLSIYLSNLRSSGYTGQLISGSLSFTVSINKSASEPHIVVSWPVTNLGLLGSDMELKSGEVSFEEGVFNVKQVKLITETVEFGGSQNINSINVTGTVPFNLSFMPFVLSPTQKEIDLTVSAVIEKLDSLPLLAMQNATIDGNGKINAKITDTVLNPQLSGDMTLRDVVYIYENVNLNQTNVRLLFDKNSIVIEEVQGDFNNGSYQASGTIGLSGYKLTDLDVSGDWSDVIWEEPGVIYATSEGSVQLVGTFDKPRLEGNAIVINGSYNQSWRNIVEGILSEKPKDRTYVVLDYPLLNSLELDINVQVPQTPPNSFWLDTIGTEIQPKVNGRIVGPINPPSQLVFVGQIDILEGEFSYLDRKFLIRTGTIENTNRYVFNPKYNIDAELATPIENVSIPNTEEPKDVRVTLNLSGTLQSPQPPVLTTEIVDATAGEQYELSQLQILSLLAFGNIVGRDGGGVSASLSETATGLITRQAETLLGRSLAKRLDLSELQLDVSEEETEPAKFRIKKEIDSHWTVTYVSTYSFSFEPYLLGVVYEINEDISIEAIRNQRGKYGVDLKYSIEW